MPLESEVSPEFLQRNAEVHDWVFGAFAELIGRTISSISKVFFCISHEIRLDNAVDANSKTLHIKKAETKISKQTLLIFQDDGTGMTPQALQNCMCFGKSEKRDDETKIGKYGVGFKSGTMRIADDVTVFTKCSDSMSIGILSQVFF
jgi:HSP90 family molecular chaperone